jgi:hypothetical protein
MKTTQLSPEQISLIYDFCYEHDVLEYEIQTELVDHLATAIEVQLAEKPEIPFKEALIDAFYQDFGIHGLREIIKSKRKSFRNQYNQLFLRFLGSFFQLPRIILTLAMILTLFSTLHFLEQRRIVLLISIGILFVFYVLFGILDYFTSRYKIKLENQEKSFLIVDYFNRLKLRVNQSGSVLYFLMLFFFKPLKSNQPAWIDLLGCTLIVLLFIAFYALMFYMPKLVKQHFTEQFPQFVKS